MGSSPAFQFYANDFTTGTQDWSVEEVGIYIRLLCYQWDKGQLPTEEKRLARICGCDLDMFQKAWVFVGLKFPLTDGECLKNKRLERTREEQLAYREKQRLNGSKGGRPRNEETQTKPKQNPTVNPNHNPNLTQNKPLLPSSSNRYINISFDVFWDAYDKKIGGRDKIEKKWNKLTDSERELIIKYIPEYKDSQPNKQYRLNPETFLNNKGWLDEIIQPTFNFKEPKLIELDSSNF